jgi:hypothetical protein
MNQKLEEKHRKEQVHDGRYREAHGNCPCERVAEKQNEHEYFSYDT